MRRLLIVFVVKLIQDSSHLWRNFHRRSLLLSLEDMKTASTGRHFHWSSRHEMIQSVRHKQPPRTRRANPPTDPESPLARAKAIPASAVTIADAIKREPRFDMLFPLAAATWAKSVFRHSPAPGGRRPAGFTVLHLRLAEEQIDHPTTAHMLSRLAAVVEHVGVRAAGFFEGVG